MESMTQLLSPSPCASSTIKRLGDRLVLRSFTSGASAPFVLSFSLSLSLPDGEVVDAAAAAAGSALLAGAGAGAGALLPAASAFFGSAIYTNRSAKQQAKHTSRKTSGE